MANNVTVYEGEIDRAMPTLANILAATPGLPARSFKAAMLSQMVRSKASDKLLACSVPSFLNCAATFAGLGLMPDGVTGQAYMLPFAGTATPVIGYKGYNTLGDRAGRTIDGNVVRDGDDFSWQEGTDPWIKHTRSAANGARITHAWAAATATGRTPLISVLTIEELEYVRNKSPAGNKSDSPWMDLNVGRPAMYAKTAKRRLARGMPLYHGRAAGYLMADAMEGRFEATGTPHYILPAQDGSLQVTDGRTGAPVDVAPPLEPGVDPTEPKTLYAQLRQGEDPDAFTSVDAWRTAMYKMIELLKRKPGRVVNFIEANKAHLDAAEALGFGQDTLLIRKAAQRAIDANP